MDAVTKETVRQRAGGCCEYCRLPQDATPLMPFHVEHIVAKQHGGGEELANLALACDRCNAYKGPNLSSIDEDTGEIVPLFHPRRDRWEEHFRIEEGMVCGETVKGRVTVTLLLMNAPRRVQLRRLYFR